MKIKTYLPIFSGFYYTLWEFDYFQIEDFIKEERKNKGLFSDYNVDDLEINFENYEIDIVQGFCNTLPYYLENFIIGIELETIVNPKTYNFKNDSANVIIDIKENEIANFIYSHKKEFCEFLKNRYTSRDGFISWYSNNFETWESETKNFLDFSINGHYLGSILDFIAIQENLSENEFYENIIERIDFLSYAKNLDEIINTSDNSLFEFLTKNGIEKYFADYIETSFDNGFINKLVLSKKILSVIQEYKLFTSEA